MDHEPMRRVAEFREVFDGEAKAERPELAEHRRTLLVEEAREAAEALTNLAKVLQTGDDPLTAYKAVARNWPTSSTSPTAPQMRWGSTCRLSSSRSIAPT